MTRGIRLAAATIGLIALAGATSLAGPAPTDQRGSFRAEVVDRATHRVRVPAGGTLVLTNMVGDIEVRAGTGPEVRVDVVRVARGRTDADARQGLAGVT
ncbi:MAG TPA: hypothetical protein VMM93_04445, partial [Vicinamibacterales bacterium]|nr:hypothetical protein [Vicinamibacterales bacterium]